MKTKFLKVVLTTMFLFTSIVLNAQSFFTPTQYRGALSDTDWTNESWVNWNPQNTDYPPTTVDVNPGDISTNTVWTNNNVYRLNGGFIYVNNGATLTIQSGTIIRGEGKGTLIICRGSKIIAQGTSNNPIVFTSNAPVGSRQPGNWGGIVITGKATHNLLSGDTTAVEGGIAKALPSRDGRYGGSDDNDNSGIISYVRIEYAGIPLTTASNSEINGLTLCSVGKQTTIDHIQVSYSGDDAFEWFGGTVNTKYLISLGTQDDDFDTDNGYRGHNQFGLAVRNPKLADQSGSNGFESDNDSQGSDRTPRTGPIFCNYTLIGPRFVGHPVLNSNFRRAAHIRRGSAMSIFNSILTGWTESGILLEGRRTVAQASLDSLMLRSLIVASSGRRNSRLLNSSSDTLNIDSANFYNWFFSQSFQNDTLSSTEDIRLVNPTNWDTINNILINPDFRPDSTSIALRRYSTHPVNVQSISIENINIYPNPVIDFINVNFENINSSRTTIEVFDINGRCIDQLMLGILPIGNQTFRIPTNDYNKGLYFIKIHNKDQTIVKKFIK